MKYIFVLILALPFYSIQASEDYIGETVPPFPASHMDLGGYMLGNANVTKFSVSHTVKAKSHFFWLAKMVGRKESGSAIFKVLDVIKLNEPLTGYYYAAGVCSINGAFDVKIIALTKIENDKELQENISKAWIANTERKKFNEIDVNGVTCYNEGWGA